MTALPRSLTLLAAAALCACDPAGGATQLEVLPRVPDNDRLMSAGFDGEQPLVVAEPGARAGGDLFVWRYDGKAWSKILSAPSLGNLKTLGRGAAVFVNVPDGGVDQFHVARIVDGVVTHSPVTGAGELIGQLSDGSLLVANGQRAWSLAAGATAFEPMQTDAGLTPWDGVVLPDDRLLNRSASGLVVLDRTGARVSAIPCGTLLCAQRDFGVGLISGKPYMVFAGSGDEGSVVARVDVESGSVVRVGTIPPPSRIAGSGSAGDIVQLAVTDRRWYAVLDREFSVIHGALDGAGASVETKPLVEQAGGLFVTDRWVWSYQPSQHLFARLPR